MPPGQHHTLPPPDIPEHRLFQRIGQGSYGEVWLAQNITGAWHAVKIIHRDRFDDAHPFEREFEGIRQCEPVSHGHEGLIDILQIGRNDRAGFFYYVMELADDCKNGPDIDPAQYRARTLYSDLQQHRRMPLADCLSVGRSIALGLAHLHKNKLVHRDIKPANIVFVDGRPKLADIGLVTSMDATYSLVGTPGYIPQEGPGHPTADIYSLGKVIYEMATGNDRHAFPALPADATGLAGLNQVLLQACDRDPQQRHATAVLLAEDLDRLIQNRPTMWQERSKRRRRIQIGAVLAVLTAGAVGQHLWEEHHRPDLQRALAVHWTPAVTTGNTMVAAGTQPAFDHQGRAGGAFYFGGSGASLVAQQPVTLASAITLTCWFKGLTEAPNSPIIQLASDGANPEMSFGTLKLDSHINNKLVLQQVGTNAVIHYQPRVESIHRIGGDGSWHQLTAIHDAHRLRLYVDGELQGTTAALPLPKVPLVLRAGLGFSGMLGDLRLYQRALSEQEIRLLSASRRALDESLVVHYPLDGDGAGITPGNDSLTLEHTLPAQNRHGLAYHALAFDGQRSWAYNHAPRGMPMRQQPRTFSFWVRQDGQQDLNRTAFNQTALLVNGYAGAQRKVAIYFQQANATAGSSAGLTASAAMPPVPLPANEWHHVVLTHDGQQARLFIDGALERTHVLPVDLYAPYLFLGVNPIQTGEVSHFRGALDDLRVYSRELSRAEVTALYNLERADPAVVVPVTTVQPPQLLFPNADFASGTLDQWQILFNPSAVDSNSTAGQDPRQFVKLVLDNDADGRYLAEVKEWAHGMVLRSPPFTVTPANRMLLARASRPFGVSSCALLIRTSAKEAVMLQRCEAAALTEYRMDLLPYLGKTVQVEFAGGWMRIDSLKTLGVAQGK